MPAAHRLGDICTGHGCFPPRSNAGASPNVFVNSIPLHRQTDGWSVHCCVPLPICHAGSLAAGSPVVFANNLQAARIGDPVDCGSAAATGSPDVFIGDTGSFAFTAHPEDPITPSSYQQANYGPPIPNHNPGNPEISSNPEYPPDPTEPVPLGKKCEFAGSTQNPYTLAASCTGDEWKETGSNPNIINTYREVGIPQSSDQTAWCAAFVGTILKRTGNDYLKTLSSRAYQNYGDPVPGNNLQEQLQNAQQGDIIVFTRNGGGYGHVAFFSSYNGSQVCYVGGNQSNRVKQSCGGTGQVVALRRPKGCQETEEQTKSPTVPPADTTVTGNDFENG